MNPSEDPPRRSHHRRRPELNINTNTNANANTTANNPTADTTSAACDDPSDDVTTPLSPPPQIPAIPCKSSQRSLRSSSAVSPSSRERRRENQPAATRTAKLSAYSYYPPDQDRDAPHIRSERDRPDRDRDPDPDLDHDTDWVKRRVVETFLDTLSPVDMSNNGNGFSNDYERDRDVPSSPPHPRTRDSHDLSLSPRNVTRDSLLGNMLLSLDQFSMGQMNDGQAGGISRTMSGFADHYHYDDDAPASRTMTSTSRALTAGHGSRGHVYSHSSDYEDSSSTMSRGRRSGSGSTGFQSNLGRINSMREMSTHRNNVSGAPASRPLHSRGGKGSKSSSTNSFDGPAAGYAQVLGSQRWAAHGLGRKRSSSFELATRQPQGVQPEQQQQQQRPPWHVEFSNGFFNDDYDAAPTPTIPVGPRRLPNMPSMPSFPRPEPMGEPLSPVRSVNLERKRSSKSSRSTNTNRQAQTSRFSPREETPPIPQPLPKSITMPVSISTPAPVPTVDLLDPAPAPNVGYEKAKDKEAVHPTVQNPVSQPPKEKPGFFKRMFGGGSKTPAAAATAAPDQSSANVTPISTSFSPSAAVASTNSPNQLSSQAKSGTSNSSSRPGSQNHSSHGLQKKPSSFFRRRKKSVPENDPPPLPPPILAPAQLPPVPNQRLEVMTPRPQPSPVTSLRKAMDPYLIISSGSASALATPLHHPDDFSDIEDDPPAVRGFSPDYEPDPKATIRSVPSESKPGGGTSPAAATGGIPRISTPTGRRGSRTQYDYERTNSFLHDETDSEDSPRRVRKRASLSALDTRSRSANRTSLAPLQTSRPVSPHSSNTTIRDKKLDRLTQDSMSTDNERPNSLQLPIEGALTTDPKLKTRVSMASIPSVKIEDSEGNSKPTTPGPDQPFDEPDFVIGDPTEYDRTKAQQIFDGKEDFLPKDKAASWMGEEGVIRQRVLRVYMDLYDFTAKNIVTCLREVCNRLVLRAETQQVDRILVAFSNRWCDCNPNHGFRSIDVIHTICYSIMLLNTDLHMADIEHKMTRSQFIKNTMTTIRQALADSAPDAFDRPSILPGKGGNLDEGRRSGEHERSSFRNSFVKLPMRAASALGDAPAELEDCGPLVKTPFDGPLKAWESQMEIVLKDTYTSIKDERLPLFGAEQPTGDHHGNLSVMGMLKRSPSVLSKAPSEGTTMRGRVADSMRASNSRWSSKSRSRPRGFGSGGLSSSRTSFDDGQSIWSPVESAATWSRGSLGRTQASLSMDSFGSHYSRGEGYQQSMGFANALSQAIIREDPMGSVTSLVSEDGKPTQLLEDESLELAGPPWVKEGMVVHKHHLDGVDKKSKDRNWSEVFAVIQKGTMNIFSFSPNKSTARRGHKAQNHKKGAVVGGGNWQDNATNLGSWNLRLTLASALPPPGYSKQRPHVWALSLPTGAVHLFQVGTPEICKEFVTTANYWSARLSTHPLVGGISNMEYGWSDNVVNSALVTAMNQPTTGPGEKGAGLGATTGTATSRQRSGSAVGRSSLHSRGSSFRSASSFDFGATQRTGSRGDPSSKLPGDRVTISEWTPPTQSMRASNAPEAQQLQTLLTYVKSIEDELQQHNVLRSSMLLAFNPRGPNMQKAMANWERKSSYLLREIVKFRTYVDCLQHAEARKKEIWREREIARKAARGSLIFDGDDDYYYDEGTAHVGGQHHGWDDEDDGEGEEDEDGGVGGRRESTYEIGEETVLEEPEGDLTLRP